VVRLEHFREQEVAAIIERLAPLRVKQLDVHPPLFPDPECG
jgi:hypothetical protein